MAGSTQRSGLMKRQGRQLTSSLKGMVQVPPRACRLVDLKLGSMLEAALPGFRG